MDDEPDIIGFAEDPDFSLEPVEKELAGWVDEEEKLVGTQFGDGSPNLLHPDNAREMAIGLERGAKGTKYAEKTNQEVALLRRAADRVENL